MGGLSTFIPAATEPDAAADAQALAAALPAGAGTLLAGDPSAQARHALTMSPAFARAAAGADRISAQWAQAFNRTDAVWVPGEFAAEALRRSGVDAERIHVVAPVVDTARFAPGGPALRPAGARGFVFLAPLDWTRASGWDVLLRAWAEEFGADEDVSLVFRAWSSLGCTPPVVAEALLAEIDALERDPADLADLILEVAPEHAEIGGEHYLGADCVVVPARADAWGRRTLEAMACGIPVIATSWGANADLLAPGAAYAVRATSEPVSVLGARELPQLDGASWGAPDVAELRDAMRKVVEDRLGAAETGLLGRVHVLERPAPEAPATLTPRADRLPRVASDAARAEDVSFVLQGPVERNGRGRTADACASIRAQFPGAEIVISTWAGTDTEGLDADVVVASDDPGAVGRNVFNPNTNRQIVSSLEGIRAASRPLIAKVRSDVLFVSDALLSHWRRWEERSDELRLVEHRVLVPNTFTRRPNHLSPYPLHPSDWSYFGAREDLELLFDVPHMRLEDSEVKGDRDPLVNLHWSHKRRPAYTPEQWIWTHALRKVAPKTHLLHEFDLRPETVRLTELSFANNLAILDTYRQYGMWNPKYPGPNRVFDDMTLYQHEQWIELYDVYCRGEVLDFEEVVSLLEALSKRDFTAEPGDVSRLRRAGLSWEAQLLECVTDGRVIRRDSTTGGQHRWHLDALAVQLAEEALPLAAAGTLRSRRGPANSIARSRPSSLVRERPSFLTRS
jgi:WavE lipopolysaccharide synthesis/Glycosyl transferases group 1